MNGLRAKWLFLLVALLSLCACSKRDDTPDKRQLFVSIPPQAWLLDSIVGDKWDVEAMLESGSNPETFEPTMTQLTRLGSAGAYFTVGSLGFEQTTLPRITENFPSLPVYETGKGVEVIAGEESHQGHAHAGVDPHIWTSARNARVMAKNMYETVLKLDPANSDYYNRRYRDLDSNLKALDDSLTSLLAPRSGCSFVVWHPSLSYFARDYGLVQLSAEEAGKETTPARYAEFNKEVQQAAPAVCFRQTEFDAKGVADIAKKLNVPEVSISLMSADIPQQLKSVADAIVRNAHN